MNRRKNRQPEIRNMRQQDSIFTIIKQGLVLALPFIMIGSGVLIILNFPIPAYHEWIQNVAGGLVRQWLLFMYNATMGVLSLVLLCTIGYSFGKSRDPEQVYIYPFLAVACYLTIVQFEDAGPTAVFGPSWIFTAIVIALGSGALFKLISTKGKKFMKQYAVGADTNFNMVLGMIIPAAIVVALFAAFHAVVVALTGDMQVSIQQMGSWLMEQLFSQLGVNLGSTILLVLLIQVFWFFGMHGSNMVDEVATGLFESGMQVNQDLIAQGQAPTEIFTKTFIDSFVFMGGSGTIICLVIAMLIWSKMKNNRKLAKVGILPVIFNINEFILFGFPIIFNRFMLIPFLLVPVTLTLVSSAAVMTGLVPIATSEVFWTTPPILSGYIATGSAAGSILQVINIVIGVLIYLPFLKRSERKQMETLKSDVASLTQITTQEEMRGKTSSLLEDHGSLTSVARMLVLDLRHAIENDEIDMYYQPQVRHNGSIYGAEALLRWNHPVAGFIYPPLIIRLAREDGYLEELDAWIFDKVCRDAQELAARFDGHMEISVNLLPSQLEQEGMYEKIRDTYEKYDLRSFDLAIEITEQMALSMSPEMMQVLDKIKALGIRFIMDDFGMGHSSMMYLQHNQLSAVKLDRQLVEHILENERSAEIISSVKKLTQNMGVDLLAEFVETVAQRERLFELGCDIYQGYLYSKAIPRDELVSFLRQNGMKERQGGVK